MKKLLFLVSAAVATTGALFAANRVIELSDTERVAIYDEPGQTQFIVPQNISGTAQVLVVGGGGAGGTTGGGGGGGGQLLFEDNVSLNAGDILSITVGAGGVATTGPASGGNGGESSLVGGIFDLHAIGGGGGGGGWSATAGKDGGNGGGAGGNSRDIKLGGQPSEGGYAGGANYGAEITPIWLDYGAGGGGAGGEGQAITNDVADGLSATAQNGGPGVSLDITGGPVIYAAGGGGGGSGNKHGYGGASDGSGDGAGSSAATQGRDGAGGGGGGGVWNSNNLPGANGGSGTVIIRYTISNSGQGAVVRVDKSTVLALSPVVFTAEVYGEGHENALLEWDFGDGSAKVTTTGLSVGHAYQAPGSYSVTLVVTFPSGEEVTSSNPDMVTVIQSVYYVDSTNENPAEPYDTRENAANDIKVALAFANSGSTIYIAPGDYAVPGNSGYILIDKPIKILGEGTDPTDVIIRQVEGDRAWFNDQVMQISHADALVANVTIQDGHASNGGWGGDIWIKPAGGTVSNCVVRNGRFSIPVQAYTGGIYMQGGLVTHTVISNCTYNRKDGSGGQPTGRAVYIDGAGRIENCLIAHNGGSGYCAVVSLNHNDAVMKNCTIVDGTASYWFNSGVKDESGNIITNALGGVHCAKGQVVNCAILDIKGPAYNDVPAKEANPWSGNADNFVNCATDGDAAINETCVLATKADFKDYAGGDFVPQVKKALYDAGDDDGILATDKDLAGNPRIFGKHVDIGCYESQRAAGLMIIVN